MSLASRIAYLDSAVPADKVGWHTLTAFSEAEAAQQEATLTGSIEFKPHDHLFVLILSCSSDESDFRHPVITTVRNPI